MSLAIDLRNISFSYSEHSGLILKNLNLQIEEGELVALQGPSGSGKSTLLYIIGCLMTKFEGSARILGVDVKSQADLDLAIYRSQTVGFIFQQFYLLAKSSVLKNILLPQNYPSERERTVDQTTRARELAEQVGLGRFLDRLPNQLSGGQQQRVAIARALLNNPKILLADEPTGSLDTATSQQIMTMLKQVHSEGRTVVIITHDPEVAAQCDRVIHIRDGQVVGSEQPSHQNGTTKQLEGGLAIRSSFQLFFTLIPDALANLRQNLTRSILNMLGITIGVAAVLSMVTIGGYTKDKILDSYADLGVNTLMFYGYPNWDLSAKDSVTSLFQGFRWREDLNPIKTVFPEVQALSPQLSSRGNSVGFGGKTIEQDVRTIGTTPDGLSITGKELLLGHGLSNYHVENRSPVCVIGYEIFERLFRNISPIGQVLFINQDQVTYGCRILGVMKIETTNKSWSKPNLHVYLPYTFFQTVAARWDADIREIVMKVDLKSDPELTGNGIKGYFERRYGKSGHFRVGSDSKLIAQMNKFLSFFTLLLGVIAMVSLGVGGIGITNMMLVSVSERLKEIGIRKAFGATHASIRMQFLAESVLICTVAGLVGVIFGFALYQTGIWGASRVIDKVKFEWIINFPALVLSLSSILAVGLLSGLIPAIRAEKLEVIEALRTDT